VPKKKTTKATALPADEGSSGLFGLGLFDSTAISGRTDDRPRHLIVYRGGGHARTRGLLGGLIISG